MFPSKFFANRYFAPRYFPNAGAAPVAQEPPDEVWDIPARGTVFTIPGRTATFDTPQRGTVFTIAPRG